MKYLYMFSKYSLYFSCFNLWTRLKLTKDLKLKQKTQQDVFVKQECLWRQKSKLAIFSKKITVKVSRLLTLVSFETQKELRMHAKNEVSITQFKSNGLC